MESVEYLTLIAKRPSEKRPVSIDFGGRLPQGATVAGCTVESKNTYSGLVDNSVLSSTTATVVDDVATIYVQAGSVDSSYRIRFRATCSDSSLLEEDILLRVEDLMAGHFS